MTPNTKLILVTGVNGFIAGHIVEQLLERGYRVRGTARGEKYRTLVDAVTKPGLEFVRIDDVATADFTAALAGVDAVLHTACPLAGADTFDATFGTAVDGTLNVVQQAHAAGIRRIVATSSFGALIHPSFVKVFGGLCIDESDWNDTTDSELAENKDNQYYIYFTAKAKMERALLAFGAEHPSSEIITIVPGYVLGPYARTFPLPAAPSALGTNATLHALITNGAPPPAPNWLVDVRDVARAHVCAATLDTAALPAAPGERRFIVNAGTYTWREAAAHLRGARVALKGRIVADGEDGALPGAPSHLVNVRTGRWLGVREYIAQEKMLEDAVDDLLMLEGVWARGAEGTGAQG